jgi:hypothetical protein
MIMRQLFQTYNGHFRSDDDTSRFVCDIFRASKVEALCLPEVGGIERPVLLMAADNLERWRRIPVDSLMLSPERWQFSEKRRGRSFYPLIYLTNEPFANEMPDSGMQIMTKMNRICPVADFLSRPSKRKERSLWAMHILNFHAFSRHVNFPFSIVLKAHHRIDGLCDKVDRFHDLACPSCCQTARFRNETETIHG